MIDDPKTGSIVSVLLIWLGAVYDYLGDRLGNVSIIVGIILGFVTIYCTLSRNAREQREFERRMRDLDNDANS